MESETGAKMIGEDFNELMGRDFYSILLSKEKKQSAKEYPQYCNLSC